MAHSPLRKLAFIRNAKEEEEKEEQEEQEEQEGGGGVGRDR